MLTFTINFFTYVDWMADKSANAFDSSATNENHRLSYKDKEMLTHGHALLMHNWPLMIWALHVPKLCPRAMLLASEWQGITLVVLQQHNPAEL